MSLDLSLSSAFGISELIRCNNVMRFCFSTFSASRAAFFLASSFCFARALDFSRKAFSCSFLTLICSSLAACIALSISIAVIGFGGFGSAGDSLSAGFPSVIAPLFVLLFCDLSAVSDPFNPVLSAFGNLSLESVPEPLLTSF